MAAPLKMTNRQHVTYGPSILDQDKQVITELPDGATFEVVSSDPAIAGIVMAENAMDFTITSGKNGRCTVTVTASGIPTLTQASDTIAVEVVGSLPGSLNLTPGTVEDDTD